MTADQRDTRTREAIAQVVREDLQSGAVRLRPGQTAEDHYRRVASAVIRQENIDNNGGR